METIQHTTSNGHTVKFQAHLKNVTWNDVAGIYAFSLKNPNGSYNILYVGQTNSFKTRFANHEHWDSAVRNGMTHVLAATVPTQTDRDKLESILISDLRPKLNTVGK